MPTSQSSKKFIMIAFMIKKQARINDANYKFGQGNNWILQMFEIQNTYFSLLPLREVIIWVEYIRFRGNLVFLTSIFRQQRAQQEWNQEWKATLRQTQTHTHISVITADNGLPRTTTSASTSNSIPRFNSRIARMLATTPRLVR